ncbi:5'-nucleotidase SurE [bacterium HR40]|nr:5'-nucleotidase SurE [bacterium HR40]
MSERRRLQRILVTNDDGVRAPGLMLLEEIARGFAEEVWVVAPETNHSGAGHSLTLRRPLRIRRLSERHFAVDGTPTDCVLLALQHIIRQPVDLVLSGINHGSNLGDDVTYSGTIAAAMEATLLGVPAIALSQACRDRDPVKWRTAATYAPEVIARLLLAPPGRDVLVNVNFPDVDPEAVCGIAVTRQGKRKIGDELVERLDPRGEPYVWIGALRQEESGGEGTDIAAVASGWVSVTPIHMDMTHYASLPTLGRLFEDVSFASAAKRVQKVGDRKAVSTNASTASGGRVAE